MLCIEIVPDATIADTRKDPQKRVIRPLSKFWWYLRYLHWQVQGSDHLALCPDHNASSAHKGVFTGSPGSILVVAKASVLDILCNGVRSAAWTWFPALDLWLVEVASALLSAAGSEAFILCYQAFCNSTTESLLLAKMT